MNSRTRALGLTGILAVAVAGLAWPASGTSEVVAPCAPAVRHDVLPAWMRGGFGPNPRIPYEIGVRGAIAAILFAQPLYSPAAPERHHNKILWVTHRVAKHVTPLWIRMQKMDGSTPVGAPVRRIITTGPGPSYVNATSTGCWRLTLTWSGRQDTLDLEYVAPTS